MLIPVLFAELLLLQLLPKDRAMDEQEFSSISLNWIQNYPTDSYEEFVVQVVFPTPIR